MSKPIGGRGKKAPYESTHVRIPEPLKDRVEQLKALYLDGQLEYNDQLIAEDHRLANEYRKVLTGNSVNINSLQKSLTSLEDTLELAKKLLKQKKSARETVAKLLTGIYGKGITVEDLKF